MKAFSSEQVASLNAKSTTGRFLEAMIFTRDQDTADKDYFIRNGRPISFKGNQYVPLQFTWEGIKITSSMELPTNKVSLNNIGNVVVDYIEDNDIIIDNNDVVLQVLYVDKFNKITLVDEMLFQVELVVANYYESATFHLGVSYSLNDVIPRGTIESQEFPGIRDDAIRVGS
jgi:hypothetical protein